MNFSSYSQIQRTRITRVTISKIKKPCVKATRLRHCPQKSWTVSSRSTLNWTLRRNFRKSRLMAVELKAVKLEKLRVKTRKTERNLQKSTYNGRKIQILKQAKVKLFWRSLRNTKLLKTPVKVAVVLLVCGLYHLIRDWRVKNWIT